MQRISFQYPNFQVCHCWMSSCNKSHLSCLMQEWDPSARGTSLMFYHSMLNQALGQKDKPGFRWCQQHMESLVIKTCWISSPPTSLFVKKPNLWQWEVKDGGGTEEGKQRASTSSLLSASCLCCLSCLKRPRRWWDTSDPAPAKAVIPWMFLVPPPAHGAPGTDAQRWGWAGTTARASQSPDLSTNSALGCSQPCCKNTAGTPPCPLDWLFTFPNSDLNDEILRWY